MHKSQPTYQVVIAGGGPVGLYLGICLHRAGISCLILEKRNKIRPGSRSLGIHPVSLELFDQLGIADEFTVRGIRISKGHAFSNSQKIGTLSFTSCPKPFNYILALPQNETESILENKLLSLDAGMLQKGTEVLNFEQAEGKVKIHFTADGRYKTVRASFLIGCDGKNSLVRKKAGISYEGKSYPDTYAMGDFTDNTSFGSEAAIFLCRQGLIESFPLVDKKRRWVVKTDRYLSFPSRKDLEKRILDRIGHDLKETENSMISSFGVQKLVADRMSKGRIILAGDAAHVVSPIGGQGMNLGWLGARDLSQALESIIKENEEIYPALSRFGKRRKKAARNAINRAEMNMRLGRKTALPAIRNSLVALMLRKPLSTLVARLFTMRGVEHWFI